MDRQEEKNIQEKIYTRNIVRKALKKTRSFTLFSYSTITIVSKLLQDLTNAFVETGNDYKIGIYNSTEEVNSFIICIAIWNFSILQSDAWESWSGSLDTKKKGHCHRSRIKIQGIVPTANQGRSHANLIFCYNLNFGLKTFALSSKNEFVYRLLAFFICRPDVIAFRNPENHTHLSKHFDISPACFQT